MPTTLKVWGSECVDCGNATPGSMVCDCCGSEKYTIPLYFREDEMARAEANLPVPQS